MDELLGDGESVLAVLGTYKESEIPGTWNILVYGEEDYILYDTSVDELDFELTDGDYVVFLPPEGEVPIEITNHYNPDEYDETPEDYSDDLTGYTFEEEEVCLSDSRPLSAAGNMTKNRSTSSSATIMSGSPSTSTASASIPARSWCRRTTSRSIARWQLFHHPQRDGLRRPER